VNHRLCDRRSRVFTKRKQTKQLEDETEKARLTTENNDYLAKCSDTAWTKAEKYFLSLSRVRQSSSLLPMYLCLALDPRDKMEWFHRKWDQYPDTKAKWMPGVRDLNHLMLQVRDEEYRDKVSTAPAVQAEVLPSPNKIQSKFARFVSARHGARSMVPPKDVDHFRQYYLSPRRSDSQGR
ncbi:hypothetical protein E4U14_008376, partial [Claviceps sp. LM454 group G7]